MQGELIFKKAVFCLLVVCLLFVSFNGNKNSASSLDKESFKISEMFNIKCWY